MAFFYEGLTYECDISGPLTIEGQNIPVVQVYEEFGTPLFPGIRATSRKKLAELLIDHSPEYKRKADAKKEHLAILAYGVETWNDWRRRDPTIRPTLYKAELSQRALSYVDFSYAD
jgi:hypothetical protein